MLWSFKTGSGFATQENKGMSDLGFISGIQQIGVGVPCLDAAWRLYRRAFGFDIPVLRAADEARVMTPYTAGRVESRDAVIALNDRGGGGLEVWQYTSRDCAKPPMPPKLGDLGINAVRLGSPDPAASLRHCQSLGLPTFGPYRDPAGRSHGWTVDPLGLPFQFAQHEERFRERRFHCGGVTGALIGVTDIERTRRLYGETLGYRRVVYDRSGVFDDLQAISGAAVPIRRILLEQDGPPQGPFARLIGRSSLELVQCLDRKPGHIFANRQWGDQGFIHLCFDVVGMDTLIDRLADAGHPARVRSDDDFAMGEAAGAFAYVEDNDGTLIELVETRRIPILRAIGWSLDLTRRDRTRPVPDWMLKALALGRVRDG